MRPLAVAACLSLLPVPGAYGADAAGGAPGADLFAERVLRAAKLAPGDVLVEVTAGDARFAPVAARRFGVRASSVRAAPAEAELRPATVVILNVTAEAALGLQARLLALKPGSRLLSMQSGLGDWAPDETLMVDGRSVNQWIVPALANGHWRLKLPGAQGRSDYRLQLSQRYQALEGTLVTSGETLPLAEATLRGNLATFAVTDRRGNTRRFFGRVTGDRIIGKFQSPTGAAREWQAQRTAPR